MKKVLSTKTLEADALAYAQSRSMHIQCVDFIKTIALPFDIEKVHPGNFDAIAFTSVNAVKYFFENHSVNASLKDKQIFALSGKTNDALLAAAIIPDIIGANAHELAHNIIAAKSARTVLHVCGSLRLPVLEEQLKSAGIYYKELVVYNTMPVYIKVDEVPDAILFFSPSGVDSFLAVNNIDNQTVCCCIGPTTAQALKEKSSHANIIMSQLPLPIEMLVTVADYWLTKTI